MIHANTTRSRRGFTLIELLVVMALIAGLAAMAMVVAPGAMNKDRAATAVTQIQGALQISRARAIRDGLPRGVRLITNGGPLITEYQYIESPQVFVPNPGAPLGINPPYPPNAPPFVQFNYTLGGPGGNSVANRQCRVYSLAPEHVLALQASAGAGGGTLYLPTLGTWHRFNQVSGPTPDPSLPGTPQYYTLTWAAPPPDQFQYPDEQLGAETQWRTYHFGIYGAPRALLGEPVMQLPQRTCVDIGQSNPAGGGADYDILFAPSGLLVNTLATQGAGQVFLLVRDPTKQPTPSVWPAPTPATYSAAGEMLVVAIKAKSGGIGAGPVDWGADPFFLAKKALSGQ